MRALIVDDHHLILAGLSELVEGGFEGAMVDGTDSGKHALELLSSNSYDVLIADLFIPGEPTFQFIREVCHRWPDLPMIVLSGSDSDTYVTKCLDAGAHGYVSKSSSQGELLAAIETVMAGGIALPQNYRNQQRHKNNAEGEDVDTLLALLSDRQIEVVRGILQGKSNKEIAHDLLLSENTVKVHVSAIIKTLGVENRTKISVIAQKANLL
jgi:DNA-binding NarL/FixJ family response regulator